MITYIRCKIYKNLVTVMNMREVGQALTVMREIEWGFKSTFLEKKKKPPYAILKHHAILVFDTNFIRKDCDTAKT